MKYVAIAVISSLTITTHGFIPSPAATGRTRSSRSVAAQTESIFMSRRLAGAHVSTGTLKMSSMNDNSQPTLEQVSE